MNFERARQAFLLALDQDTLDRNRILSEFRAEDSDIGCQVEAWLAADRERGSFSDTDSAETTSRLPSPDPPAILGRQIGAYQLVKQIGQGGMSTVFLAKRADGLFQKEVAIKIIERLFIRPTLEQVIERERRALAALEHANIARLYDAGITDDGIAYLVMEFVDGSRITDHCAEQNLSIRDRLKLFARVCDAVSYAHARLIVHRDLKPSNIMVTGSGVPKLIDFGIAKLLDEGSDHERAVTTIFHLTPAYASPEQIAGKTVTTTSDIYSLGIVLFEILTGKRPDQVQADCSLPDKLTVKPSKINPELSADIDAIILMALRSEADRRYASVEQFRNDIQRHLSNLPVQAQPDSRQYRWRKFYQRHTLALIAGSISGVLILAGCISTLVYARQADARRDEAYFLTFSVLRNATHLVKERPGTLDARKFALSSGVEYMRTQINLYGREEKLERILHIALGELGLVLGSPQTANLGDTAGALRCSLEALELAKRDMSHHPTSEVHHHFVTTHHQEAGRQLLEMGDLSGAFQHFQFAAAIDNKVPFGYYPDAGGRLYSRAKSHYLLAGVLAEMDDGERAVRERDVALKILRERVERLGDINTQRNLAAGLYYCGLVSRRLSRPEALPFFEESLVMWTALRKTQMDNVYFRLFWTKLEYEIGVNLVANNKTREGAQYLDTAVRSFRDLAQMDTASWSIKRNLGAALAEQARVFLLLRERRRARRLAEEAEQLTRAASHHDPASARAQQEWLTASKILQKTI